MSEKQYLKALEDEIRKSRKPRTGMEVESAAFKRARSVFER